VKFVDNVDLYSGTDGGFHSPIHQTSLPNGFLYADKKNERKQKGFLKTFGEVFK